MTHDLQSNILTQIARATSRRPARATEVLALVGGPGSAFWHALEQLVDTHRVATAYIQKPARDPAPWLAIWPTGVHARTGSWTGNSHSCLFVPTPAISAATHKAQAPRVRAVAPEPEPAAPRALGKLQQAVLDAARGRTCADALRFVDLCGQIHCTQQTLASCVRRLASQRRLGIAELTPRGKSRLAVYDLAAEAQAVATEVAA